MILSLIMIFASIAVGCLSLTCGVAFAIAAREKRTDEAYALLIVAGGLGAASIVLAISAGRFL